KGIANLPYPRVAPGADAVYAIDETLDLSEVRPMIAKPFSPGNAFPADDVAREHLSFDKAMIGSCTNGSYDDLLAAALVVRAARAKGATRAAKEVVGFPGSGGVGVRVSPREGRPAPAASRDAGAPRRRVDRRRVPIGRRRDPPVVVRAVLRSGPR